MATNAAQTQTRTSLHCAWCDQPAPARIVANRKVYCGKLCAAFGLIDAVNEEDGIDDSTCLFRDAINCILMEGPRPIPRKVRWEDAECGPEPIEEQTGLKNVKVVVIDDEGTPDWKANPDLYPEEEDVDRVVSNLLQDAGLDGQA